MRIWTFRALAERIKGSYHLEIVEQQLKTRLQMLHPCPLREFSPNYKFAPKTFNASGALTCAFAGISPAKLFILELRDLDKTSEISSEFEFQL
jgi:hypothetical protein